MSGIFVDNQGPNWKKVIYHGKSAFAVILSLAVLIGMAVFAYNKANQFYLDWKSAEDYLGPGGEEVMVTVPNGASVNQIGYQLVDLDVVKSKKAFDKAVRNVGDKAKFEAGRFKLKKQMPAKEAVDILSDPKNMVRVMVTLPEALTMDEQWDLIPKKVPEIKRPMLEKQAKASKDPKSLGLPAWAKAPNTPEGFMFPETYEVDDTPTAAELMKLQATQFNKVATELNLEDRAKQQKLTPLQIVVLASIAEKEGKGEDLPMITGVFYNRLAKKMPLQSDATVLYANGVKGRLTTTDEERAINSPYNTYKAKGLPPGPISNPGKQALNAALSPKKHDYLYFVVVDPSTGKTEYNKDIKGHEKSVAKFQAWCQANKGQC